MTDQATITSLVQFAGRSFPGAIHGRREPPAAPAPREPERAGAAAKSADPVTTSQTPLLAGETQIAAQQNPAQGKIQPGDSPPAAPSVSAHQVGELTDEQKKKVQELQDRDRTVRAHEAAHKLTAGSYAGQPTFETVKGPDGHSYAVGGEVAIDTSEVPNNPDATISKLETVIRAALAPSDPSAQDRQVAAEATAKIQEARQEKQQKETKELEKAKDAGSKADPGPNAPPRTNDFGPAAAGQPNPITRGTTSHRPALGAGTLFNLVA